METVIDVLVLDDSDREARTTLNGIRRASDSARVLRLKDGEQALEYLYCTGTFQDRSRTLPRMILLDLDLPSVDGMTVLERLRADPKTQQLPVVVLTSSQDPRLVEQAYARGASAYLAKPQDKGEYMSEVARVVSRWLQV